MDNPMTPRPITHPEAQGNKDLGEPAASGLEVTGKMIRLALEAYYQTQGELIHYDESDHERMRDALTAALQAALAAAPTSPQPIKGESDAEKAERDLRRLVAEAERLGILPKTEYKTEHYRFQREQSRETKAATWEDRPDAPEPWYRIIGAASGYVALAYATWRMLPFLAAVVRAL